MHTITGSWADVRRRRRRRREGDGGGGVAEVEEVLVRLLPAPWVSKES